MEEQGLQKAVESKEELNQKASAPTAELAHPDLSDKAIDLSDKAVDLSDKAVDLSDKAVDLLDKAVDLSDKAVDLSDKAVDLLDKAVEDKKSKVAKKTILRKSILYTFFILFNVVALAMVLFFENRTGDMLAGKKVIKILGKNYYYTMIIFGIFLIQIFVDSTAFYFLTKQVGVKKNILLSIRTSIIGKYYDKLTPWATGGEPVQMVYLSTHGLDTPTGCAIPLAKTTIRVFTTSIIVFLVLAFSGIKVNIYITIVAYISLVANLFFPVLFIIFIRHKEWGQKVTKWTIRLLCKLKLVKDYDTQYAKFSIMVENFLKGMGYLSAHKKMIVIVALMTLIELVAINSIPFFIMKAFGFGNINYWEILVYCLFVTYASYFAPSPGSAGVAELSFYTIFATVITGSYLFWAILLWRIILYYLPIISGIILQVSEGITTLIRKRRKKAPTPLPPKPETTQASP